MDDRTVAFLRKAYREYYFKNHDKIEIPTKISEREFGYIPFGGGMTRHLSFKSAGELVAELVKQAPSSMYCSNATYSNPTLQMDEKGWKGAELIFDLDAGAIPTSCAKRHTFWLCDTCGRSTLGARPAGCAGCAGTNHSQVHWSCAECLGATKQHVFRLIDFLTKDFGASPSDIHVYFSGNRGYHLHVLDERFEPLDPPARAEIANYIRGTGLLAAEARGEQQTDLTATQSFGWPQRMMMVASSSSPASPVKRPSQRFLDQVTSSYGAMIDEAVTTDVHRIFRMPGTLHGSSGFLKMRVNDLDRFEPGSDPVVLGEEKVNTLIRFAPEFSLKGVKFGPYNKPSQASLPAYAAAFLLTKGLGSLVAA